MVLEPVRSRGARRHALPCLLALLTCLLLPGPGHAFTLPDSGQTSCFDDAQQITCPTAKSDAYYGQDGNFLSAPMSYTDNGDGTVTDNNTGLTWQQTPDRSGLTWANATTYCTNLRTGDHTDWRLPSRREIATLVSFNRDSPSLAYLLEMPNMEESFWTATTYVVDTTQAYALSQGDDYIELHAKDTSATSLATRCVRGDALPAFAPSDDGQTITDTTTGLMWEKNFSNTQIYWKDALAYCSSLTTGDHTDWRVPNITELYTLLDDTTSNPALPAGFGQVSGAPILWSGTSLFYAPQYAMVMGVADEGRSFRWAKTTGYEHTDFPKVICVRSGPSLAPTLGSYAAGAVTAPAAGASLNFGTAATLQWDSTALSGATVDLYAINDTRSEIGDTAPDAALVARMAAVKFASAVPNSGSYAFAPKALNILGETTKILVVSNTQNWGLTPGLFTVSATLPAPTALAATLVRPTSFTANWQAVSDATSYLLSVYDKTASAYVGNLNKLDVGAVTSYAVTGLTPGHVYRYAVQAALGAGTSGGSNVITVTAPSVEDAPLNLLLMDEAN